jgi:hypothetical protein
MVYLQILCNLILIFAVFEPSKINYARGLILMIGFLPQFNLPCTPGFFSQQNRELGTRIMGK